MEEIFPPEELLEDEKAQKEKQKIDLQEAEPMEVFKETLDLNQPINEKKSSKNKTKK